VGLILCREESVTRPLYIESLEVRLYSSYELCYFIYHFPLLALDHFLDDDLLRFLREDLDLGHLAAKLERGADMGEAPEGLLVAVLQECEYFTQREVDQFQKQLDVYRSLNEADYAKAKADAYVKRGQQKKAAILYEQMLKLTGKPYDRPKWRGEVWAALGAARARMFAFESAMEALDHAYKYLQSGDILKQMYVLTILEPTLTLDPGYMEIIGVAQIARWDQEVGRMQDEVRGDDKWGQIGEMDETAVDALLESWKQEYRSV
jgi:tetratricopeptide (TPR) repeat protein